ncbi:autotransporter assembly complex protein TamA [Parvularcula marina]|uniref:Outer membrane protein assembly factor n=1 Tax=Parvularcula marina TaxID=2292771 RepID=A0A371REL3_9PROT|nr:autotransporter assembly complex family protein [Parvularcula marina]RFB03882.1 outer membrane protein assembly factor [Parvularcula marina]
MRELRPWTLAAGACLIMAPAAAIAAAELDVAVELTGIENEALHKEMRVLSKVARGKETYTALAPLRRAVEQDARAIERALRSKGYYAANVVPDIKRTGLDVRVTIAVTPGEKFTVTDYVIIYVDDQPNERPADFAAIGKTPKGDPAGKKLEELSDALVSYLWNNGYPATEEIERQVEARFEDSTATAVFRLRTGPIATYGDIRTEGLKRTDTDFIAAHFRPAEGDIYSRKQIDKFRTRLAGTSLFREVAIEPAPPAADGRTDLLVTVEERKHRTIGAGVSFGTDVGIGATANWENRNIFGGGERLSTELKWSAPAQDLEVIFEDPLPRWPGSWNTSLLLENETTDAFEAQTATVGAGVTKKFFESKWELSAGLRYTISDITDFSDPDFPDGFEETFQTASLPFAAAYNNENNALNPTSGYRLRAEVTPFFGDLQFNRAELSAASRIGFGSTKRFLIAGRARMGATIGASGTDLPATERFFAGGGGSVRGYAFQEAGPIDSETGNPTGGASVAEVNLETRFRVQEKIQIALFADGGSVFESETPDFSGDFLVGAGVGVRYLTPIGPIRLDVATPLDKREIRGLRENEDGMLEEQTIFQDDPIQVYIALGQPF